jgi:hypothetical protein
MRRAVSLARDSDGNNMLARIAMMEMTTSSSISVKAFVFGAGRLFTNFFFKKSYQFSAVMSK